MTEGRVAAQGKINLRLRVLGREPSGYHVIETIFHRVALSDAVTVRVGGTDRRVRCHGATAADVGPEESNLAYRAAAAYSERTGWPTGFDIEIEKRIPVGGGMGGGSADAGAVLRILDALAPAPLGAEQLLEVARTIGSDVPFLTLDAAMAIGEGRGDELTPSKGLAERPVALVVAPFGVSTGDAYGWVTGDRPPGFRSGPVPMRTPADWTAMKALAVNDFDNPVSRRHPSLAATIQILREAGAAIAMLSGSGSTVIGVFDAPSRPSVNLERMVPEGSRVVWTTTASAVDSVSR